MKTLTNFKDIYNYVNVDVPEDIAKKLFELTKTNSNIDIDELGDGINIWGLSYDLIKLIAEKQGFHVWSHGILGEIFDNRELVIRYVNQFQTRTECVDLDEDREDALVIIKDVLAHGSLDIVKDNEKISNLCSIYKWRYDRDENAIYSTTKKLEICISEDGSKKYFYCVNRY